MSAEKIFAMFPITGASAHRAAALYKRLPAACGSRPSTMERIGILCFLAVVLAGKRVALVFCHRLWKQDTKVIPMEELLGEAIIFHGKGENGHGCNSAWGDCGKMTGLACLEIQPGPTVCSGLGHQHRHTGVSGTIQLLRVTLCFASLLWFSPSYRRGWFGPEPNKRRTCLNLLLDKEGTSAANAFEMCGWTQNVKINTIKLKVTW